jgi:AraC-like DNA-binding protein
MLEEINKKEENYEAVCQNLLEVIMLCMLRHNNLSIVQSSNVLLNSECARIKKYLDANYAENITLDTLAALSHMNKYYMAHAFAKYMGVSPITYLLQKRIEEGKSLLSSTSHSISQIATSLGFSSQSYFSQAFKKATGRTPVQYRAECKRGRQGTV